MNNYLLGTRLLLFALWICALSPISNAQPWSTARGEIIKALAYVEPEQAEKKNGLYVIKELSLDLRFSDSEKRREIFEILKSRKPFRTPTGQYVDFSELIDSIDKSPSSNWENDVVILKSNVERTNSTCSKLLTFIRRLSNWQ